MNNLEQRRERFMKDSLQVRLGGLAANLARISSFAKNPANLEAVRGLIEESKFFIEWTAPETQIEKSSELVDLQINLALLHRNLHENWGNDESRLRIGDQAKTWSKQVLETAGLI
ncbi:MAG TPA: hypothetical protein VK892_23450 [Pyrinomonadaceae bacterium]|nr:hypothetical protein [Pyrinomonadaceae bacterium]